MNKIENKEIPDNKNLDKLANLYSEGVKNKEKNSFSRLFNGIVIILSCISAICLGIMISYLIYAYC